MDGLIAFGAREGRAKKASARKASIVLGDGIVTYRYHDAMAGPYQPRWITCPMRDVDYIEWAEYPFQPEGGDEIAFLQQFIANLSPDDLEAAVEAQIGENGMHRQGEWIKAALLGMVPE